MEIYSVKSKKNPEATIVLCGGMYEYTWEWCQEKKSEVSFFSKKVSLANKFRLREILK